MDPRAEESIVRISVDVIQRLRRERGWSIKECANKAILSSRNLKRVLQLGYCRRNTLKKLAHAFDLKDITSLLAEASIVGRNKAEAESSIIPDARDDSQIVTIVLPIPARLFHTDHVTKFMQALSSAIEQAGNSVVLTVTFSSVHIDVYFSDDHDILRLVTAFINERLMVLAISSIEIPAVPSRVDALRSMASSMLTTERNTMSVAISTYRASHDMMANNSTHREYFTFMIKDDDKWFGSPAYLENRWRLFFNLPYHM